MDWRSLLGHAPSASDELDPRWYARLFDRLGQRYDDYPFTQGTEQEVAFLVAELDLHAPLRVLDVGCGTARHAVAFAERGFTVTGVDLAGRFLEIGLERARKHGVVVNLIHADAREMTFESSYDVALSLCEGAFGLLEDDRENRRVLERMAAALKPGGRLAMSALNRRFYSTRPAEFPGYDPQTGMTEYSESMTYESGRSEIVRYRDRSYWEAELRDLLADCGFEADAVYGAIAGDYARRPVGDDHVEMLVLGRRKGRPRVAADPARTR